MVVGTVPRTSNPKVDVSPVASPPLFILGAPRSGTSALYKALCLHPEATWLSNVERRAPRVPALAVLNRVARWAPATRQRVWFGADGAKAYAYGGPRSLVQRTFPQPVEGEPVFAAAGIPAVAGTPGASPRQLRLRRDLERRRRAAGGRVLVSKRIAHNTRIPLLHTVFPDARFAVITRDGRAVAASLSRVDWWPDSPLWWYGGTPADWAAGGGDPYEVCARHWVEEVGAIERGLVDVPVAQVVRVRYEDLVGDPTGTLLRVAAGGGLAPSLQWQRSLAAVRFPDQNEAWRTRLGSSAATVERLQSAELERLGYL